MNVNKKIRESNLSSQEKSILMPLGLLCPSCVPDVLPRCAEPKCGAVCGVLLQENFAHPLFPSFLNLQLPNTTIAIMATAADNSLPALLSSLTASLADATQVLPEKDALFPPKDGISLLDTKNDLFLSYIQNLVFLILVKLRHTKLKGSSEDRAQELVDLNDKVVKNLAELRLYLDKGVKPLEGRLKYQVDKVVKAADEATTQPQQPASRLKKTTTINDKAHAERDSDISASGSGDDGSDDDSDESAEVDELSYRPNPAALLRPADATATSDRAGGQKGGLYKPPRITPTSLPTTVGKEARGVRRPAKSATIDEFIATELSSAPIAEPSIGSTIRSGGRHTLSQRERDEHAEKKVYEESNFIRLPKESKKDRTKKSRGDGFGGEEFRNLGIGLDRIEKMTKKQSGSGGQLANSRKRAVQDGPRDSGEQFGMQFAKRQKGMPKRAR
jgi:U3 small nucleolar ribonucleoprotein protein LCP5